MSWLLYDLISLRQHRWRDRQPECLRGLEIYHELVLPRLLEHPMDLPAPSVNDLVRAKHERRRNRQTESLCPLRTDHEPELGRLLNGKISRLCPFENLVNEVRG